MRKSQIKWFTCICQEVGPEFLLPSDEAIGIDVGLKTFAALFDGYFIENPRFFHRDEKALAKAQRKLSKQKRGSRERKRVIRRRIVLLAATVLTGGKAAPKRNSLTAGICVRCVDCP